jgi:DNA/RNA endonuclease G (NUC1)
VIVYVGPVITAGDDKIGAQHVDVPSAFFKVVVDPKTSEAIGFYFDKAGAPKGDPSGFLMSISGIESAAAISLPVPFGVDKGIAPSMWDFDLKAWRTAKKASCH